MGVVGGGYIMWEHIYQVLWPSGAFYDRGGHVSFFPRWDILGEGIVAVLAASLVESENV